MNLQVQDIIKDAMGLIGATEMDETPSASEMSTALRIVNVMLGRWSIQTSIIRSPGQLNFPLQVGKNSYTIGLSGADITAKKPIEVISGFVRDSSNIDSNVEIIPIELFDSFDDKNINQADPACVAYDPGVTQQASQVGTIHVYPTPSSADTMFLRITCQLEQFVNLTDEVTMEASYYEALIYNLAIRLFRRFHTTGEIPSDIVAIANNSIRNLQSSNSSRVQAQMDFCVGGGYNIYTDE